MRPAFADMLVHPVPMDIMQGPPRSSIFDMLININERITLNQYGRSLIIVSYMMSSSHFGKIASRFDM